jgi:hypothetical protein
MSNKNETTFRIDDSQLDKILAASSPVPRKGLRVEEWAKLVEVAAVVIGGIWVLVMFLAHEREFHMLTNDTLRFAAQLQNIAVEAANQSPLKVDSDVSVERLPTKAADLQDFDAHLTLNVKNPSLHEVEIAESEVQVFLGDLQLPKEGGYTIMVNRPRDQGATNESAGADGPIAWKLAQTYRYVSLSEMNRRRERSGDRQLPEGVIVGHPAFGVLLHDEEGNSQTEYRIRSKADRWIGFIIKFKLVGDDDWTWTVDDFRDLALQEAAKPATAKTNGTPRP